MCELLNSSRLIGFKVGIFRISPIKVGVKTVLR